MRWIAIVITPKHTRPPPDVIAKKFSKQKPCDLHLGAISKTMESDEISSIDYLR